MTSHLFLGIDSSTQGMKASIISSKSLGTVIHYRAINFDRDLPHYKTKDGMFTNGAQVQSPTLMWLEALDLLLSQMMEDQIQGTSTSGQPFRFSDIVAISGSGQQHGSVYWKKGASMNLNSLDSNVPLAIQLGYSFAKMNSPIWADSSTGDQCASLEEKMGGPMNVAVATGSRAYERFTGLQIAKIKQLEEKTVYDQCERISLVSSFMCSIFLGKYAPIDTSDGSGTNLNNIMANNGIDWHNDAVEHCGGVELYEKLGSKMVPSHSCLGQISNYFVYRYGFSPSCNVISWSGDNPCSLAGVGLQQPGDVAVSMGTSDCMFTFMENATPGSDGHVLRNPVDPLSFMGLLCFKNGSLVRENISNQYCNGNWETFATMLNSTPPGNNGHIALYYDSPEITPSTGSKCGTQRFSADGQLVDSFSDPCIDVRAVVEGKFMAMRHFGESIGMDIQSCTKIIATGGASNNNAILQVMSDVFGCNVYTLDQSDSASLGAAFRALHGHVCHKSKSFVKYKHVIPPGVFGYNLACIPQEGVTKIYDGLMEMFVTCQSKFVKSLLS